MRFEDTDSVSSVGTLTSTESLSVRSFELNSNSNKDNSAEEKSPTVKQQSPRQKSFETEIENLIQDFEEDLVVDSDANMFSHKKTVWTNGDGNEVSSHIVLMPSATEIEDVNIEVCPITRKSIKIFYTEPNMLTNTEIVMEAQNLDATHAKVVAFRKEFNEEKEKLKFRPKVLTMEVQLPFEVESEPIWKELNYRKKSQMYLDDGRIVCHIMYILGFDLISRKQHKEKMSIGGGQFFGF